MSKLKNIVIITFCISSLNIDHSSNRPGESEWCKKLRERIEKDKNPVTRTANRFLYARACG